MTLTSAQPFPHPVPLPDGYRRAAPGLAEQRSALTGLLGSSDWAALTWPELIDALLALGRTDLGLARLGEGHVDARRILDQAGAPAEPGALYGVWASRSQRTGVTARPVPGGWRLDGTLRFASGAGLLDRALVPVWPDEERHLLVDLPVAGLPVDESAWQTWAMTTSRTHTVAVRGVRIGVRQVVGEENFYLERPGFFPGGVGVAACWAGGAARVTDLLRRAHPEPHPRQQLRFGRIRVELVAAAAALRGAAALLEATLPRGRVVQDRTPGDRGAGDRHWQALSTEVRAVVAAAVERVLGEARHLTGPPGLALDGDLARAVADLELYVRQQNADADAELLGTEVAGEARSADHHADGGGS